MAVSSGVAGGMSGAVRAGKAFVELTTQDAGLKAGLASAKKMIISWGAGIAAAGAGLIGIGAAVLTPIIASFRSAIHEMSELKDASERLGATTDDLQELAYAAQQTGNSFEDVASAAAIMQKNLVESPEAFAAIGLEADKLRQLGMADQFGEIAKAINKLDKESATAAARGIFGRGGARLVGMLKDLDRLRRRAHLVGIFDEKDIESADRMGDAIRDLELAFTRTFQSVGVALLPTVEAVEKFTDVVLANLKTVRDWIKANSMLVIGISAVAAALIVLGAVGVGVGTALIAVGLALDAVITITGLLLSPLVLLGAAIGVTAIAGLAFGVALAAMVDHMMTGQTVATVFANAIRGLGEAFGGFANALKAGNIGLAWEILLNGMEVAWHAFLSTITEDLRKLVKVGFLPAILALKELGDQDKKMIDAMRKGQELRARAFFGANLAAIRDLIAAGLIGIPSGRAAAAANTFAATRGAFAGRGIGAELRVAGERIEDKQLKQLEEINGGVKDLNGKMGGIRVD